MDDKSDKFIHFDSNQHCDYCTEALENLNKYYFLHQKNDTALKALIEQVRKEGKDKKYDCMMGISGGLDSSYVAYLGTMKYGLRVLAFHVDDGYDTEISKRNIQRLANLPNLNMKIISPDAKQFNEITRAFLLAGVPNVAMPQDNILFAELYKAAKRYKVQSFMTGANYALESILQRGNTHSNDDVTNIKDIFKRYGRGKINKLHFISSFDKDIYHHFYGFKNLRILDLIDYNREKAISELNASIGFEYYGSKHLENDLTKFIQLYWFPHKFNVDKRKSHYSSMIVSGQMTREEALSLMEKPLYDEEDMRKTISMLKQRLDISDKEFKDIMSSKTHQHTDFKTTHYDEWKGRIKSLLNYQPKRKY